VVKLLTARSPPANFHTDTVQRQHTARAEAIGFSAVLWCCKVGVVGDCAWARLCYMSHSVSSQAANKRLPGQQCACMQGLRLVRTSAACLSPFMSLVHQVVIRVAKPSLTVKFNHEPIGSSSKATQQLDCLAIDTQVTEFVHLHAASNRGAACM
jgi:hypothetical protein